MDVYEDELIELEARAILIRSYVQILTQAPVDEPNTAAATNAYLQKLHAHVCALEPLAARVGRLRWLLAYRQPPQRLPDSDLIPGAWGRDISSLS